MNIGIFGGTFDPPHNGHINLAIKIIKETDIDKIIFVLSASPPHKPGHPISSFHHRMNMLKLAIDGIEPFSTSDIEYKRLPKLSFTFDTMLELESTHRDKLVLIIGADSLNQLHLWHRGKDIVKKWEIITYPRKGENISLESLSKNWSSKTARKLLGTILPTSVFSVSATYIRNEIIDKEKIKTLVKPEILDYINKNYLYQNPDYTKAKKGN